MRTNRQRGRTWRSRLGEWGLVCVIVVSVLLLSVRSSEAADRVRFTDDGYLILDGKPRLLIGSYELPKDDADLKALADNGFNLVRGSANQDVLDRIHRHGLHAWIPLGGTLILPKDDPAASQKLSEVIRRFKDHPALICWEAPDEALWNVWYGRYGWFSGQQPKTLRGLIAKAKGKHGAEAAARWTAELNRAIDLTLRGLWKESEAIYAKLWTQLGAKNPHPERNMSLAIDQAHQLGESLSRGWRLVRSIDPARVRWQNHAPRNSIAGLRWHNREVDAAGCDIYPVPFNYAVGHSDLTDMNVTSVGAYTDRMRAGAPGKAVWMVLQGFGWKDIHDVSKLPPDPRRGRRPNFQETRFMAYNAVVHGANAILYWGTQAIEKDSALWGDLLKIAKEIRALESAIVGDRPDEVPAARSEETYGSVDGQGPRLLLRKTGEDWVLIAVNEMGAAGLAFDVTGLPNALNGKTLYRLYSDESHAVSGGGFRDGIRGHDVHVYATSRRFETR